MAVKDSGLGIVVEIDKRGNKSHGSVTESCLKNQIKGIIDLNRIKMVTRSCLESQIKGKKETNRSKTVTGSCLESQIKENLNLNKIQIISYIFDLEAKTLTRSQESEIDEGDQ